MAGLDPVIHRTALLVFLAPLQCDRALYGRPHCRFSFFGQREPGG